MSKRGYLTGNSVNQHEAHGAKKGGLDTHGFEIFQAHVEVQIGGDILREIRPVKRYVPEYHDTWILKGCLERKKRRQTFVDLGNFLF